MMGGVDDDCDDSAEADERGGIKGGMRHVEEQ